MPHFAVRAAILTLALALTAGAAQAEVTPRTTFKLMMDGRAVVPPPSDYKQQGFALLMFDPGTNELCDEITVISIIDSREAHIHRGGPGVNGPILASLHVSQKNRRNGVTCVPVAPAIVQEILKNPPGYYIDVHSSNFPNGVARGQMPLR